jgi:ABC-type multidrug transport system ATPase subunit
VETISPALRIRQLVKVFTRPAVDCIDLTIARGEFYALLGPNGAGKTTTLRMISGLLLPDRGSIEVFGLNVVTQARQAKHLFLDNVLRAADLDRHLDAALNALTGKDTVRVVNDHRLKPVAWRIGASSGRGVEE